DYFLEYQIIHYKINFDRKVIKLNEDLLKFCNYISNMFLKYKKYKRDSTIENFIDLTGISNHSVRFNHVMNNLKSFIEKYNQNKNNFDNLMNNFEYYFENKEKTIIDFYNYQYL